MTSLALLLGLLPVCYGHMSMQYPYPRDNGGTYPKWKANEPMVSAHPQICHGLNGDTTIRDGNSFAVGDTIEIDMYGSANHNGGHCTFWYSTNDITFTKIIDIKDCTISDSVQVTLPSTLPIECETKCTFAFTWIPTSSGVCEIYMNCADIKVNGVLGGNSNPISMNFQTNYIDLASSNYGCIRVDDTTHWSSAMGVVKLDYDDNVVINNGAAVITADIDNAVCYKDEKLAMNLDSDLSNVGVCGIESDSYRCDDGYCCSWAGYCGTTDAYCSDPIADWRVIQCPSTDDSNLIVFSACFITVFPLFSFLCIM